MAVAREVASGVADVGIGLQAAAHSFGLDFVALSDVKFDVLIPSVTSISRQINVLRDVLQGGPLRAELAPLPGYDSSQTGCVRSRFETVA